jgi:hypothetical protein
MRERTFVVDDELTLKLRPVSTYKLRSIASEYNKTKPMPPIVEVDLGNNRMAKDYNENDKIYLHCKEIWETEQSDAIAKYVLLAGVHDNPPQSFVDNHLEMFPDEALDDIKLYWLTSFDAEKLLELINLLTGQSSVTKEGLAKAAATFPSEGERDGRAAMETPAAESGQGK